MNENPIYQNFLRFALCFYVFDYLFDLVRGYLMFGLLFVSSVIMVSLLANILVKILKSWVIVKDKPYQGLTRGFLLNLLWVYLGNIFPQYTDWLVGECFTMIVIILIWGVFPKDKIRKWIKSKLPDKKVFGKPIGLN